MTNSINLERPKRASLVKVRFIITVMTTLCPTVCYIARQNMSMAVVSMVKSGDSSDVSAILTNNTSDNARLADDQASLGSCPLPTVLADDGHIEVAPKVTSYGPKYQWATSDTSLIFEAFFWTYVIFQIPGARVAERIGAKWILFTAAAGSSLISLLSPLAASYHVYLLVLLRAIMGVCQAALYPACYALYSYWLPPLERSKALPLLGVGTYIGSIVASSSTGYFSEQEHLGWEYGFYMPCAACAIWSIIWIMVGSSDPRDHKFISLEEIEYIESRLEVKRVVEPSLKLDANFVQPMVVTKKKVSWIKIIKSQHIWAMSCALLATNWSFSIVLLLVPSYLNFILQIPPFRNGLINSIIYILYCVSSPIVGAVSTRMIETRPAGLTRLQIRKLFQCSSLFGQAICFLSLPFIGCNTNLVLVILYAQIIFYSFVNGGEVQLPSELSLDFAGTIYAIGNCIGSSTGFIVPRVHSWIVQNQRERTDWNHYFYVAAAVTSIGGIIFLLFGKNDLQDFAEDEKPQPTPSPAQQQQKAIDPTVDMMKKL